MIRLERKSFDSIPLWTEMKSMWKLEEALQKKGIDE